MQDEKIRECWTKFVSDEKYKKYFMSNDEAWHDNLEKVKKFIDMENKRPDSNSKNQDEKSLGSWISNQLHGYSKKTHIMSDKKIRECWRKFVDDEKYKEYFISNEEVWHDNLEKVKNFIDKESKRPSITSKNQDEKYLGSWIGKQLNMYNKKTEIMSDKIIRECWRKFVSDEKYKKYFILNDEVWYDNLEKVKKFIDTWNKRPNSNSKNQDEKYLGQWISHQPMKYNKKTGIMSDEKIQKCWKKFVDDEKYKKYFMSIEDAWYDNLEKVKKFIDKESKRPSITSKNQDEKSLGSWIGNQLTKYNKKTQIMSNEKIQEYWEKLISNKKYKKYFRPSDGNQQVLVK